MDIMKSIFSFSSIFLLITISTSPATSAYSIGSKPYIPVPLMKTQLRFFLHDTLSGPNPTAVRIAGTNATGYGPIPFGALFAVDDPVTEGPEATSESIGNAHGLYLSSSQGQLPSLVVYFDIRFTSGEYSGSSLSVFSRNPVTESRRELAVVGGTGKFRRATGTIIVTSHYVDGATGDAILEYNVDVVHPIELGFGYA